MASPSIIRKGVALADTPGMKFILDGRMASSAGPQHWDLRRHGFAFFEHKTALQLKDFHSPPPPSQTLQQLFRFSGGSAVVSAPPSSWTAAYYKEVAEACKRLLPTAEAVFVPYHILRKADLSFSTRKYATAPRVAESQVHKLASQVASVLDTLEFLPVAEQEKHLQNLNDGDNEGAEEFCQVMCTNLNLTPELQREVTEVLRNDEHYSFLPRAQEVLKSLAAKRQDVVVQPRNPESQAHQVVSQIIANFQYLEMYPKSYKRAAAVRLHTEGQAGVEAYLAELVSTHSLPRSQNPYGLMPDASPELQREVLALLRDDAEHYDFVARSRRMFPRPGPEEGEELDAVDFQPPAVGGGHTDVSAEGYLSQLRAAIPEEHELGRPGPGKRRRVVFLKLWRNVADTAVANHHLAVLDKSSLSDSDIYEAEINFKGMSIKQNRMSSTVEAEKLNWVYFPGMQRDEVLCFQQGDLTMSCSAAGGPQPSRITFPDLRRDHATFHGAFEDPTAPSGAPPRQSVEAGAFVFLPEEPEVLSKL